MIMTLYRMLCFIYIFVCVESGLFSWLFNNNGNKKLQELELEVTPITGTKTFDSDAKTKGSVNNFVDMVESRSYMTGEERVQVPAVGMELLYGEARSKASYDSSVLENPPISDSDIDSSPVPEAELVVTSEKEVDKGPYNSDSSLPSTPFEISSLDEKFLAEASKLTSLEFSELDVCTHKVILSLQASCTNLTEEELRKVAVNLLNCQSQSEGRKTYICTKDMAIEECTRDMDSHTWTAYHVVSNRALSVCYSVRQQQFRAKTEIAVNHLMSAAEGQLEAMQNLKNSHDMIQAVATETIRNLSYGHQMLRLQQQQLSTGAKEITKHSATNLKLIASGQRKLAAVTNAIRQKLDETYSQLSLKEEEQKMAHQKILMDLSGIQAEAVKAWEKLDESTSAILAMHENTLSYYHKLQQELQQMNATIHHLMTLLHHTQKRVEDKLSWVISLIGGADEAVNKIYVCLSHLVSLCILMIAASFLQAPLFSRLLIILLVPLNAWSEVKHGLSCDFVQITALLVFFVLMELALQFLWHMNARVHGNLEKVEGSGHLSVQHKDSSPLVLKNDGADKNRLGNLSVIHNTDSSVQPLPYSSFKHLNCSREFSSDEDSPLKSRSNLAACQQPISRNNFTADACSGGHNESFNLNEETMSTDTACAPEFLDVTSMYTPDDSVPLKGHLNLSSRATLKKTCSAFCKSGLACRNAPSHGDLCHKHFNGSREATPAPHDVSTRR